MPELPDLTVYVEALQQRIVGRQLQRVRIVSLFLLRTAVPPISSFEGRRVTSLRRIGKRLRSENHTLKRALTDPHLFAGIGNAYSDEILHAARLSPVLLTSRISDEELERLHQAVHQQLAYWTHRMRAEAAGNFPEKVTAFRDGMAVHGRFKLPCPVCGTPVQRIRYADNETNYCARCQTGGKLLADRALSRLLKQDWPKSIDEL
jgi:formamidopyrimidine-DNA glycosylase